MKKITELLTTPKMTALSGIFLFLGLLLSMPDTGISPYLNPCIITVLISGVPLVYAAIRKLIYNSGLGKISSALLISVAMAASIAIGDLFAAGEVAFIMAIGEILEDKTTEKAKKGLKKLVSLAPASARRIVNGKEEIIPSKNISKGDIIRILPGESIAVDGVIISGSTSVDQSVITGESLPVDKEAGEEVFCGTINRFGSIDVRATQVGKDSSLEKLIRLVKEAEKNKAPMQRIADKWASILVPVALLLAVIAGIVRRDITVAVTVLVVFCPCALVLATPTAIMASIGQATKHGVIIKSGDALEKMGKANVIAFDKTGTITCGKPEVSDVVSICDSLTQDQLLYITACAEMKSEHPLGKAIVEKAKKTQELQAPDIFEMQAGKGICAVINGKKITCGSRKFMAENNIDIESDGQKWFDTFSSMGKAVVATAENGKLVGIIALSDTLRPHVKQTVEKLSSSKIKTVLLTGDNRASAEYFAKQAGIDIVMADLLPEDKVSAVKELQKNNNTVCMIGDGVNDAPALKTADIGIAMGTMGSDIAVQASDIAIMNDDISKIPYLKRLSTAALKTIKFGISLSLLINFAAIALSFFKLLNPTTGALVHNLGSFLVILIASLLYDRKFDD